MASSEDWVKFCGELDQAFHPWHRSGKEVLVNQPTLEKTFLYFARVIKEVVDGLLLYKKKASSGRQTT